MKYCSKCGQIIDDDAVFCSKCGYNEKQNAYANSNTQNSGNNSSLNINMSDKTVNLLLLLLGFFVPLAGLVLYIVLKDSDPEKSKSAGKGALIGVCVSVVLSIASVILSVIFSFIFSSTSFLY